MERTEIGGNFYRSFYERSQEYVKNDEQENDKHNGYTEEAQRIETPTAQAPKSQVIIVPQELYLLLALMALCIVAIATIALNKE